MPKASRAVAASRGSAARCENIVHNDAYAGQRGYPAIIEPERHARILDGLRRLEPSAVQRRQGGRRPAHTSYFLRGVAFCLRCGAALYTREQAVGRVHVCANRRPLRPAAPSTRAEERRLARAR